MLQPIKSLVNDPKNARLHGERNIEAIAESLRKFGQHRPAVARRDTREVYVGNGMLEAARGLGWTHLAVIFTDDSETEARARALADNRTGELARWDDEVLGELLGEVRASTDIDELVTGFTGTEIDELLGTLSEPPSNGADSEPSEPPPIVALPTQHVSREGDVWELGSLGHIVVCGDATNPETVNLALNGERAAMAFTDPPYGVMFGSQSEGNAIRGDLSQTVIPFSFELLVQALEENGRLYCCGGSGNFEMYRRMFDKYLAMEPRILVWRKETFVLRANNYHSQFELIYFGWRGKGGGAEFWYGDRKQSDVWEIARDQKGRIHPTQKPVELCRKAITNSTGSGDRVFDPFGGSGSTLIACEQTGRRCSMIELDPKYVDAIILRWQGLTKQKAKAVSVEGLRTGAGFNDAAKLRAVDLDDVEEVEVEDGDGPNDA